MNGVTDRVPPRVVLSPATRRGGGVRAAAGGARRAPGGAACTDPERLQRLLGAELRSDALGGDEGWRLRYQVESGGDGEWTVRVDVLGRDGRPYLTRAISHSSGDCQSLADAATLIVERLVSDLGWTTGRPLPAPADIAVVVKPPLPPAPPSSLLVTAGAGAWTRSQRGATGALGLRWERGSVDGDLSLLVPAANQEETRPAGGKATLSAIAVAASPGLRWQARPLQLRAGPVAVVGYEWARTEGITQPRQNTRFTLAAGLAAGTAYSLSPRWRLGLDVWGTVAAIGDRFIVEGWGPVLAPPRFQVVALLGAACALWP